MKKAVEYSLSAKKCDFESVKIKHSKDAADFARKFYFDDILIYESVFIMLINRANNVTGYAKISQGGVAGATVDKLIICKYAVESLCKSVIMVHNHPSGQLIPSQGDIAISHDVKRALNTLGIDLADSIILTDTGYLSLADEERI